MYLGAQPIYNENNVQYASLQSHLNENKNYICRLKAEKDIKVPSILLYFRYTIELAVIENGIKHIGHRLEKLVAQYST